jgi:sec-independent protein translocase protein TatA
LCKDARLIESLYDKRTPRGKFSARNQRLRSRGKKVMPGGWELILIVAVLFLLFGASRLPQLAKSLGQTRRAFKEGMREAEEEARLEEEQRRLNAASPVAPQIKSVGEEDLSAESSRREALKQQ